MRVEQVAEILQVKPVQVFKLIRATPARLALPASLVDGLYDIPDSLFEEWIERRKFFTEETLLAKFENESEAKSEIDIAGAAIHAWSRLRLRSRNDVYFVVCDALNAVKIGTANNATRRFAELQAGCPADLRIACVVLGGMTLEREFHRIFEPYRLRNEWFMFTETIRRFIQVAEESTAIITANRWRCGLVKSSNS